jgi:hypothetical protein
MITIMDSISFGFLEKGLVDTGICDGVKPRDARLWSFFCKFLGPTDCERWIWYCIILVLFGEIPD